MDKCFENCRYATFCVTSNNEGQRSKGAYCSFGAGFELPDTVVCKICNQFRKDEELSAEQKLEQVRELIAGIDANPCGSTIKEFVDAMQAVCGIVGVDSKAFDKLRRL